MHKAVVRSHPMESGTLLALVSTARSTLGLLPEVQMDVDTGIRTPTLGVFSASLCAVLLRRLPPSAQRDELLQDLGEALMEQRNRDGTWSFEGPQGNYPPDMDDSALALAATHGVRDARGDLLRLLSHVTLSPAGLVPTWLYPVTGRENVVDIVVNLHLVAALRSVGLPAAWLAAAVRRAVRASTARSEYYCSPQVVATAASAALGIHAANWDWRVRLAPDALFRWAPGGFQPEFLFRQRRAEVFYSSVALSGLYATLGRSGWRESIGRRPDRSAA